MRERERGLKNERERGGGGGGELKTLVLLNPLRPRQAVQGGEKENNVVT